MMEDAPTAPAPAASLAALDLFALGRAAAEARDRRWNGRGSFVRTRQLEGTGAWRGPRDAAEAYIDEADLAAVGGLEAARAAGVGLVVAGRELGVVTAATDAGLRVLWRVPFAGGETDAERL